MLSCLAGTDVRSGNGEQKLTLINTELMMATASGTLSEAGEQNLPPLSPNIEASQLLTPLQLGRITIDNPQ